MKKQGRFASWRGGLALGMIALLAACATPQARIERNLEYFNTLGSTEQALIKEGKVAVGFTPEMVKLAVGDPDQRWARTDAAGRSEIWSYTTYDGNDGTPLFGGYYHRYAGGYPAYYDGIVITGARAREYFKVTFTAGKVSAIEQDTR